jgi:hypothetical protein
VLAADTVAGIEDIRTRRHPWTAVALWLIVALLAALLFWR